MGSCDFRFVICSFLDGLVEEENFSSMKVDVQCSPEGTLARGVSGADAWFTPGRFSIVLGLLILAGFPEVVLGTHTFVARDFGFFGYPIACYHRESFWRGEIPLWNPLNNCGLPFLAQWNTLSLYPGSLFYLLLPLSWSLGVFCLLHLFWGGLGMYWLAWNWTGNRLGASVAGLGFALNGLVLNSLMWPNNSAAFGWMPWVVLLAEPAWRKGGKQLLLAAGVGAMQMLTGAPEVILLTWLLVSLLALSFLVRGKLPRSALLRRFGCLVALVAGLASAQLLPFLDLVAHSQRDEHFYESAWAMPGTGWANLLVPLFHCFKTSREVYFQHDQYWTSSYYPGAGVLALALLAVSRARDRRAWFLVFAAALGLVLALGDNGHLYSWIKRALPQIGYVRYPIKFVVWTVFSVPLLAAFAFGPARAARPTALNRSGAVAAALAVALTGIIGGLIWFAYLYPEDRERWLDTAISGVSRAAFLWVILGFWISLQTVGRFSKSIPARFVLLAVIGADTLTWAPKHSPTVPRGAYDPHILQVTPQPVHGESRAMVTFDAHQKFNTVSAASAVNDFLVKRSGLFADCNLLEAIPKVDGFYSLYLRHAYEVTSLLYLQTNGPHAAKILHPTNLVYFDGLLDFLGVSQMSMPDRYYDWAPRTNYLPLATVGQQPILADEETSLRRMVSRDFDARREVFLTQEAGVSLSSTNARTGQITKTRYADQSAELEITSVQGTLLVLAQSHYHPWRAALDGNPTRIWRANHAFQAVEVPPGLHVVRLVYEDRMFACGAIISAATLLFCLITSVKQRRQKVR
jgi:hypothetical protein